MEQKTYWWRGLVIFFSGILVVLGLIYDNYFCFANGSKDCLLDNLRIVFFEPLFFFSLALFFVSSFLFFVSDKVFVCWLRFTVPWFIASALLIALTPQSSGSFFPSNPEKESVSIWLSVLFVLISLAKLVWDTKTLRQGGEK